MSVSPGTLSYKRQWLHVASERSVTQQVLEVSLGVAGQIRIDSDELSSRAVDHTTASEKLNIG